MFKKKTQENQRKWKSMLIKRDKDARKYYRILRYVEAPNGVRVFIEKIRNYDLYVVSVGTNPGKVEVKAIATKLKGAVIVAHNELAALAGPVNPAKK